MDEARHNVLGLDGVSAGYDGVTVLREVSMAVWGGGLVGLIGPNGAGKTTLLRVMGGALATQAGRVALEGRELGALPRRELARIVAFVPQSLALPVSLTVRELVSMGRAPYVSGWMMLSRHDEEVVDRSLSMTDVAGLAERRLDEISAGERQRAMLAMALAQEPRLLLLDEPTAHLDIQHAWRLMELIHGLNARKGLTVVLSSHDLNLAAEFCSEVVLMNAGRVVAQGVPGAVMESARLSSVYGYTLDVLKLDDGRAPVVVPRRSRG